MPYDHNFTSMIHSNVQFLGNSCMLCFTFTLRSNIMHLVLKLFVT